MGRWWSELNGTVRGFIVILLIAAIIFVLNLEGTLVSLSLILQIVFFLAIAVVLYMFWRDRMRHEVDTWSQRSRWVFYGSALLVILDFGVYFWPATRCGASGAPSVPTGISGLPTRLGACGFGLGSGTSAGIPTRRRTCARSSAAKTRVKLTRSTWGEPDSEPASLSATRPRSPRPTSKRLSLRQTPRPSLGAVECA